MNKLITLLLICALAIPLMACRSDSGKEPEQNQSRQVEPAKPATAEEISPSENSFPSQPMSVLEAEIKLKIGYGSPVTNPRHLVASAFADWVRGQTAGRVAIELFPEEILGSDSQMTKLVSIGTLDMCITAHGVLASYEPKLAALELPFLFDSPEKIGALLDGPIGQELAADLPAKGIRVLAYWENGFRQVTNNVRPINTPADLKGLKIRTPENAMTLAIFKALGANPSPLPFPELYPALAQGVFDGQENPIANIHAAKFYKVQKYLALTNHKYESCPMIVSEQVWQRLAPDIQAILSTGAVKFAREHRALVLEQEMELLAALEAQGMEITRPSLPPFVKASAGVYDEYENKLGKGLIDRIRNAVR